MATQVSSVTVQVTCLDPRSQYQSALHIVCAKCVCACGVSLEGCIVAGSSTHSLCHMCLFSIDQCAASALQVSR